MIQYLTSATVIWLVSLLTYELLLAKEPRHTANRIYLLGTLFCGLLVPLITSEPVYNIQEPVYRTVGHIASAGTTPPGVVTSAVKATSAIHIPWLFIVYLAGLAVALFITVKDVLRIYHLYSKGQVMSLYGCRIVETGKAHGPFSAFNLVFLSAADNYTDIELQMLLAHERRHIRLYHSADLMALSILRILLWFHPLIYWYINRLKAVHEFQADKVKGLDASQYGALLLSESMLYNTPFLSNSFYSANMRRRFTMLQRIPSGKFGIAKYALVMPLLIVIMLGCTKNRTAEVPVQKENKLYYKGNVFEARYLTGLEMMEHASDSVHWCGYVRALYPMKLNGQPIYQWKQVSTSPRYIGKYSNLETEVFEKLKPDLEKLRDGAYSLSSMQIIVDAKGKVVYYNTRPMWRIPEELQKLPPFKGTGPSYRFEFSTDPHPEDSVELNHIVRRCSEVLEGVGFKPATFKGQPVAAYLDRMLDFGRNPAIVIKNHEAKLVAVNNPL